MSIHTTTSTKWVRGNLRILLATVLLAASVLSHADVLSGQVVSVSDGDTITLLDAYKTQHKIRLAGIDAPEKAQPFGQTSKQSLSELVINQEVNVLWKKRDRYQRLVGKVLIKDIDVCLEQIKRGMAWHYKEYQSEQSSQDRMKYNLAEKEARANKIGLWADESPVEPSKFRRPK